MHPKSAIVVSYFIGIIYCNGLSLSCLETSKKPMTDISSIYNCKAYILASGDAVCEGNTLGYRDFYRLRFKTLEEVPKINNGKTEGNSICLGLHYITAQFSYDGYGNDYYESSYTVDFNSSMAVGILKIGQTVWNSRRSYNISLLNDILLLNVFINSTTPWSRYFWNFSSPFYGMDLRWFQGISTYGDTVWPPFFEPLQNTSIQFLNITDMYYGDQEVVVIKNMPLLKTLIFKNSYLESFHNDSFIGTPNIKDLIVSNSRTFEIPTIIQRIPSLRNLEFTMCSYNSSEMIIPKQSLSFLRELESLNLSHNRFYSFSDILPPLPRLKVLILCKCGIYEIKEADFIFPSLQKLDLSHNSISYLSASTFAHLRNLKLLDLSKNQLANWPNLYGISLKILNLSQNSLTHMKNLGKTGVTVEFLNISMNKISMWEDQHIFLLDEFGINLLKHNYVDDNQHSPNVPHAKTEPIKIVQTVRFNSQQLRKADSKNFKFNFLWVTRIDLSNNLITSLTETMMESFNGFQHVDLGGNHFDCIDCRMLRFQRWLNTTAVNVTNLGTLEPLLCSSPINHKDTPIVMVQFDEGPCLVKQTSLWSLIGIPVATALIFISIACGVLYHFRSPIAYIVHLYKIRRRARHCSVSIDNKYAFDAFICYSAYNRKFVLTKLTPLLENGCERYTLCLHERDFPLGSQIVENIVGSIQHSRKTIIILSEHFVNSKWCKWELEMANHKMFHDDEHFLILIELEKLDRSKLPRHLQFLMDTRTYLEWPPPGQKEEEVYQRLKTALGPSIFQRTNERAPLLSDIVNDC